MMSKYSKVVVSVALLASTSGISNVYAADGGAAARAEAPGETGPRGIARIEDATRYNYFVDRPGGGYLIYSGFGHKIPIRNDFSYNGGMRFWAVQDRDHSSWGPPRSITEGSLTDDIKSAMLDKEEFDLALDEDRYFEAWRMGGDNEQGEKWRRRAAAGAKKKCKELGMESVLLEASDPTESRALAEKAGRIFTSFPEGNPLREELRAQFERGRRLATPPAPGVEAELAVHRGIIARLLEE